MNTDEIRMSTGTTSTINGPQGHVSATVASVALLEWGLQRLYNNLQPFNLCNKSPKLYDTGRRKLSLHCAHEAGEHVHDGIY